VQNRRAAAAKRCSVLQNGTVKMPRSAMNRRVCWKAQACAVQRVRVNSSSARHLQTPAVARLRQCLPRACPVSPAAAAQRAVQQRQPAGKPRHECASKRVHETVAER
jgi:hypothetical protein